MRTLFCFALAVAVSSSSFAAAFTRTVNDMSFGRPGVRATLLADGRVVVSGATPSAVAPTVDIFNPATNTFAPVGQDVIRRFFHTSTLLPSGQILFAGGFVSNSESTNCALYDPATGVATATGSLGTGRAGHAAVLVGTRVFVFGGASGNGVEAYDTTTGTWSQAGNLVLERRNNVSAHLVGTGVYVSSPETPIIERYDTITETSVTALTLPSSNGPRTSVLLADGRILFVSFGVHRMNGAIHDPATAGTGPTPDLLHSPHRAVLLADGRVLLVGGLLHNRPDPTAQLFDPSTLRYSVTRRMWVHRHLPAVVRLNDGRVLAAGGDVAATTAETYDLAGPGHVRGDLNMDGRADVIWAHPDTRLFVWFMNGVIGNGAPMPRIHPSQFPANPFYAATGLLELDGGSIDLLAPSVPSLTLHYATFGDPNLQMNSHPDRMLYTGGPYPFVHAGDIDGDGVDDTIWRHPSTADLAIRKMTVLGHASERLYAAMPAYDLAAVEDFNGDGRSDILWRHKTTGENLMWLMDGYDPIAVGPIIPVPDLNFRVAGTGDFNGDGKGDLVWRNNTTGETVLWLMDGLPMDGAPLPNMPSLDWRIASFGDYDGDGKCDLFLRNIANGETAVWLMDGFNVTLSNSVATVTEPGWNVLVH